MGACLRNCALHYSTVSLSRRVTFVVALEELPYTNGTEKSKRSQTLAQKIRVIDQESAGRHEQNQMHI